MRRRSRPKHAPSRGKGRSILLNVRLKPHAALPWERFAPTQVAAPPHRIAREQGVSGWRTDTGQVPDGP